MCKISLTILILVKRLNQIKSIKILIMSNESLRLGVEIHIKLGVAGSAFLNK